MLIGEKVCLGPVLQPDAAVIFNWQNTVSLMHLNGNYIPVSQRYFDEWFGGIGKDPSRVVFSIRRHGSLALLGYIQLTEIHPIFRSALLGIMIGDTVNRGKGYGQEALKLCIGFSWKDLNLQRLSLMIIGDNEPAMRAYKKVGFEQEGVLKRAFFTNGAYVDATIMGLLRTDGQARKAMQARAGSQRESLITRSQCVTPSCNVSCSGFRYASIAAARPTELL